MALLANVIFTVIVLLCSYFLMYDPYRDFMNEVISAGVFIYCLLTTVVVTVVCLGVIWL